MSVLLDSFEVRASELSAYMKFLVLLDEESVKLSLPKKQSWKNRSIDEKVLRILKASFFLLLYNLVEASTREGFQSLYNAIAGDGCKFRELAPEMRTRWVDAEVRAAQKLGATQESYQKAARRLVQQVIDDERAVLEGAALRFGGNLDAAKIREICSAHGIPHKTHRRTKGGEKLLVVKNRRNALAHGEVSFVECGRDYTVAELRVIKDESVLYLRSILRNIDRFTLNRTYRA